jgi:hypothetical protein
MLTEAQLRSFLAGMEKQRDFHNQAIAKLERKQVRTMTESDWASRKMHEHDYQQMLGATTALRMVLDPSMGGILSDEDWNEEES